MTEPDHPATPLREALMARIRSDGPISVASYMAEALLHPRFGYYATRDPLGVEGDFITAPEISQIFGELLGLAALQTWRDMGRPDRIDIIELGPGRGTLAADLARVARLDPAFVEAARLILVEASAALQAAQASALAHAPFPVAWQRLEQIGQGTAPALMVANEFLDCLPIRQFVRDGGDWYERLVGLSENGEQLQFQRAVVPLAAADLALIPARLREAPDGALVEVAPGLAQLADLITDRLVRSGGRAWFIDYGPARSETGDTLQAIRRHHKVDPLALPGEADLTARVDFETARSSFLRALHARGVEEAASSCPEPVTQGAFLEQLGIMARLQALIDARPGERDRLMRQVARLTATEGMGGQFRVLCVSAPGLPAAPGFAR